MPVPQFRPWLRLLSPLIELNLPISRIRLSDRTSRDRPRRGARGRASRKAHIREACIARTPHRVLAPQPLALSDQLRVVFAPTDNRRLFTAHYHSRSSEEHFHARSHLVRAKAITVCACPAKRAAKSALQCD